MLNIRIPDFIKAEIVKPVFNKECAKCRALLMGRTAIAVSWKEKVSPCVTTEICVECFNKLLPELEASVKKQNEERLGKLKGIKVKLLYGTQEQE